MPLEPEDQRHLTAAEGFVELGMFLDVNAELEKIDPHIRHVPEVLGIRLEIYRALKKWELMQAVASKLAKYDPDQVQWAVAWAYTTRRAESLQRAKAILEHALEMHPREAILHLNLACYECQTGNVQGAKERLQEAFGIEPKLRLQALQD